MNTLKEIVQLDLERAKGLIKAVHPSPIDAQFRLVMPTGEYWLGITLGDDEKERDERVKLIGDLFGVRGVSAYTLAVETNEPDGILCIGVCESDIGLTEETIEEFHNINFSNISEKIAYETQDIFALYQTIDRNPLSFSEMTELKKEQTIQISTEFPVNGMMRAILPRKRRNELEQWFGDNGKFPLVPIISS